MAKGWFLYSGCAVYSVFLSLKGAYALFTIFSDAGGTSNKISNPIYMVKITTLSERHAEVQSTMCSCVHIQTCDTPILQMPLML